MPLVPLLFELAYSDWLATWSEQERELDPAQLPAGLADRIHLDRGFPPVRIPSERYRRARFAGELVEEKIEDSSFVISAEVDQASLGALERWLGESPPGVLGFFADVRVGQFSSTEEEGQSRGESSPTVADVEKGLCTGELGDRGMTGCGVDLTLVDVGFKRENVRAVLSSLKLVNLDEQASRQLTGRNDAGAATTANLHGTMCAAAAAVTASDATFIDAAIPDKFGPRIKYLMRLYPILRRVLSLKLQKGSLGMVVNHSWQLFDTCDDFPKGHRANYSHNPNHCLSRLVSQLAADGADQIFPAGNCGLQEADHRCNTRGRTIYGANSHPDVLCVGAVNIKGEPQPYSGLGPGYLECLKPDVSVFSDFVGTGKPRFEKTSSACALAAGCVAAIRSRLPYDPRNRATHPAAIRDILIKTANSPTPGRWNCELGWGVIDMRSVLKVLDETGL